MIDVIVILHIMLIKFGETEWDEWIDFDNFSNFDDGTTRAPYKDSSKLSQDIPT